VIRSLSRLHGDERGSVLVETALGVGLILGVALPFASLVSYATYAARDLAAVQAAVRNAARTERAESTDPSIAFTCGASASTVDAPCPATLVRGSYVAAAKDTAVTLPFGLTARTSGRGVARVE
jgi:Flp pilus assembly protein TadG